MIFFLVEVVWGMGYDVPLGRGSTGYGVWDMRYGVWGMYLFVP